MTLTKKLCRTIYFLFAILLIAACSQSATPLPNLVATSTLPPVNTPVPITELFSITEVALVRTQPAYASNTPVIDVDNAEFGGSGQVRAATWTVVPTETSPPTAIPADTIPAATATGAGLIAPATLERDIFTNTPVASIQVAAISTGTDTLVPTVAIPAATALSPTATLTETPAEPTHTPLPSEIPPPTTTPAVVLDMTEAEIRAYLEAAPMSYKPVHRMREIYAIGQSQWQRDNSTVIGVGDCNTAHRYFLKPLHQENTDEMGVDMSYAESESARMTVAHFEDSFENPWQSAHVGYNAFSVLDAFSTTSSACDPNESPLDCDIRRYSPIAAFVMFGPNDLNVLKSPEYEAALRMIIESSINKGVIPILSTFIYSKEYGDAGKFMKSERHNAIIISLAYEYQIPFVNLWRATRHMDYQGIHTDNAHLRNEGLNERNRLAIEMLDVIRREIISPEVAIQPTTQ